MSVTKSQSASTVAEIQKLLEEDESFICTKIKDFAMLKCNIADRFENTAYSGQSFFNLLSETVNAADEFYTNLLSIYGALVEMEVEGTEQ